MNNKKLLVSAGVLAVVVAIIITANHLGARRPSDSSVKIFPSLTENTISSFTVRDKDNSVTIKRTGDVWIVAGDGQSAVESGLDLSAQSGTETPAVSDAKTAASEYPADSASVRSAIEKLVEMKRGELISQNPEKQPALEVDTVKGLFVTVLNEKGAVAGTIIIGKSGPDWSSNYVRMVGSDNVYSVGGSIRHAFFTDKKRWRDKHIVKFSKDDAQNIVLSKRSGHTIALAASRDTADNIVWNMTSPEQLPAEKSKVDVLLNKLSNFTAADYEENRSLSDSDMGLDNPELTVSVVLSNGQEKRVFVGNKKEDARQFWVRAEGKEKFVFLVSEYDIEILDTNVDKLKAEGKS